LNRVLFRADAGLDVGLGHLNRCVALAAALKELDADCLFIDSADHIVRRVTAVFGFRIAGVGREIPGSERDLKEVLDLSYRNKCDVAVLDSYYLNSAYLAALRKSGLFVVAIDDLARFPFPCQLVVNSGARAQQLLYTSSSGDTEFLLGPKYVSLRPEFWDIGRREVHVEVQNVLLTVGGGDPHNLIPRLLVSLDRMSGNFGVTAMIGPFSQNLDEVEQTVESCTRMVSLVKDPVLVRDLMLQADLAISAGGQTLYELAATGTPTIGLQVAENQAQNLHALEAEGVLTVAGSARDSDLLPRVMAAVQQMVETSELRKRMSMTGQRLIDGRGATRVAEFITSHQLHIQRHHE